MHLILGLLHYPFLFWQSPMVAIILCIVTASPVFAQISAASKMEQADSVESIQSIDIADQVLREAKQKRLAADQRFAQEENACYEKFFANACVQDARENRRLVLMKIRTIEVEANAFKRRVHSEEHDRKVAEKYAQREHERNQRSAEQVRSERGMIKEPTHTTASAGNDRDIQQNYIEEHDQRVVQHQARIKDLKLKEARNARQRAKNIAAYQRKAHDAEVRQREIAAKKSEDDKK
ncbi:MAG TPA: hypothetical protein VJ577_16535 [Burkholderiaceae bacterium]|nr:hypothetical protein [Burkholderiaceae bacterium]